VRVPSPHQPLKTEYIRCDLHVVSEVKHLSIGH
jgi:hypothetical protein